MNMGPEVIDDECECCGRVNVIVMRCRLMGAERICSACISTWYETGIRDRVKLGQESLKSGDEWFTDDWPK